MVFSASIGLEAAPEEGVRYFKRRLKLKDIDKQKYYVPAEKFDQAAVQGRVQERHPARHGASEGIGSAVRGHQDRNCKRRRLTDDE